MKIRYVITILISIFIFSIASTSCYSNDSSKNKILELQSLLEEKNEEIEKLEDELRVKENQLEIASEEKTYKEIFTFSGSGAKKSEPFIIEGNRFKIKYNCTGELSQAFLYKVGDDLYLELVVNTMGSIQDENIFYGSGEYYIDTNMIGNFTMTVYDYK